MYVLILKKKVEILIIPEISDLGGSKEHHRLRGIVDFVRLIRFLPQYKLEY